MMAPHETLTDFFARRADTGSDRHLGRVELGLMHHLLNQRDFATLDSVLAHCRDPRNLGEFLPDPRDRRLFSRRLVDALMQFRTETTGATDSTWGPSPASG